MSDAKNPATGWLLDDARAIFKLFNRVCHELGPEDVPERVIARRMRLMGAWLRDTANTVFDDAEETAVAACNSFWARRESGERGGGDDDQSA